MIRPIEVEVTSRFVGKLNQTPALTPLASAARCADHLVQDFPLSNQIYGESHLLLGTQTPRQMRISRHTRIDCTPIRCDWFSLASQSLWVDGMHKTRLSQRMLPVIIQGALGAAIGAFMGTTCFVLFAGLTLSAPLSFLTSAALGAAMTASCGAWHALTSYHQAHAMFRDLDAICQIYEVDLTEVPQDETDIRKTKELLQAKTNKHHAWAVRVAAQDAIALLYPSDANGLETPLPQPWPKDVWLDHVDIGPHDNVHRTPQA